MPQPDGSPTKGERFQVTMNLFQVIGVAAGITFGVVWGPYSVRAPNWVTFVLAGAVIVGSLLLAAACVALLAARSRRQTGPGPAQKKARLRLVPLTRRKDRP